MAHDELAKLRFKAKHAVVSMLREGEDDADAPETDAEAELEADLEEEETPEEEVCNV